MARETRAVSAVRPRRVRADRALVEQGLVESRARAQAFILAGRVYDGERRVEKPGQLVPTDRALGLRGADHPWVSRGGVKLAHALERFAIDPRGLVAIDLGASTGGFTDVLLPRVVVLERVNARSLSGSEVPEAVDLIVCDVSFIGLKLVLPASMALARPGA